MSRTSRTRAGVVFAFSSAVPPTQYPENSVLVIVPFAVGAATEMIVARVFAPPLGWRIR